MKKYILTFIFLQLFLLKLSAQLIVSSYNNETEIKAPTSVTLVDGFHAMGNVRIYTTGASFKQCIPLVSSPSTNQNFILTRTFRVPGVTESTISQGRQTCEENQTIQYFDGLGRPLQTVTLQGSPTGADLIQPFSYDGFGREPLKYLSYAASTNGGAYRADALQAGAGLINFYNPGGGGNSGDQLGGGLVRIPHPYSATVFEPSPLNRVVEQGAPGTPWQPVAGSTAGHTLKTEYGTNGGDVKLWNVTAGGATAAWYAAGTLYKTISKDENWVSGTLGTIEEYKDLEGRVVLKRVNSESGALNTYYAYDDLGNLRYVIPPAVTLDAFSENDDAFLQFIYGYHYDGRKRVVEKKIPGKDWESMVYNTLDQVVLSQDKEQKKLGQWVFTKYDAFGRVIMTGLYNDTQSRSTLQDHVNGLASNPSYKSWEERPEGSDYTNTAFPTTIADYLTVNYYDNYGFPGNSYGEPGTGQAPKERVKSLLTGSKTKVLGTAVMLLSVNYYDLEGQVIQSKSGNYMGGSDVVDNHYSFIGELESSTRTHTANGVTTKIETDYEYDHMGRKLATKQRINDAPETVLAKFDYAENGQLKTKNLHSTDGGSSFLAHTDFTYNERGWMVSSNTGQLFNMSLGYNSGAAPHWNGNITSQTYTNGGSSGTFNYHYDALNRLIKGEVSPTVMSEVLTYDVMGNIKTLIRDNNPMLTYNYTGNRLDNIPGLTGAYAYDENGNATRDGRNGKDITYNLLNLPKTVSGGISYIYSATGEKLQKITPGETINYAGGIQYKANGSIDFIQTEEGIAQNNESNGYSYRYNLSDHLGNVRATFYQNPNNNLLEVLQRDDYYAFGKRNSLASGTNKYLYNGKELQDELGQYDYGARFYDPIIGRLNVVDVLSEEMRSHSPYNYGLNNPLRYTDPDGNAPTDIIIRGKGNSSVTIKTELIDIEVNASSLGIDFGGNYEFGGNDILQAGLDIVGIFDPTGVADALSAKMSWDQGDYWGAAASAAGALPIIVGDVAKVGKIGKAVDKFGDAIKAADKATDLAKAESRAAKLSKVERSGKDFTKAGKEAVIDVNKANNGGTVKCSTCKVETTPATQSKRGVKPSKQETQVDHVTPKSKGGSGTPNNGQVLCRGCNIKKSDH